MLIPVSGTPVTTEAPVTPNSRVSNVTATSAIGIATARAEWIRRMLLQLLNLSGTLISDLRTLKLSNGMGMRFYDCQ